MCVCAINYIGAFIWFEGFMVVFLQLRWSFPFSPAMGFLGFCKCVKLDLAVILSCCLWNLLYAVNMHDICIPIMANKVFHDNPEGRRSCLGVCVWIFCSDEVSGFAAALMKSWLVSAELITWCRPYGPLAEGFQMMLRGLTPTPPHAPSASLFLIKAPRRRL